MDNAHKSILNRAETEEAAKHFQDLLNLLDEMTDYGSHLIPRVIPDTGRDIKAICLVFFQLRQFLVHLDGFSILLKKGNCSTAILQLRAMWEIGLMMEYILHSDTETKANYLWVSNLRMRRRWQSKAIPGTAEYIELTAQRPDPIPVTAEQLTGLQEEVQSINDALSDEPFFSIDAKFQQFFAQRNYDKAWYEIYGGGSIRKVAETLGKQNEYSVFYNTYSGISHGSDFWKSIDFSGTGIAINPLREPQDIPSMANQAASFSFRVYEMILKEYRPGELENFCLKFLRDWQPITRKQYNVTVQPQTQFI